MKEIDAGINTAAVLIANLFRVSVSDHEWRGSTPKDASISSVSLEIWRISPAFSSQR